MSLQRLLNKTAQNQALLKVVPTCLAVREGHTIRGKAPGVARTLEQRMNEETQEDAELTARVNIGFPKLRPSRSQQLKERLAHLKAQRADASLEKMARSNQLSIDLDLVQQEYRKTSGQYDLRVIADHYGIFKDLFGCAYFVPRVALDIKYQSDADAYNPVYNGNIIKPAEAKNAPLVSFDGTSDIITDEKCQQDSYWTLIASNPDAHFTDSSAEYAHWFVGNIPNGDVSKGETLIDYLQPFPAKGVGYQRFVFVLYKQNAKLNFDNYKINASEQRNLEKRTFKTLDFYAKYQDDLTPAGLAFYQTDYDKSLTKFYHDVLQINEPIYEYDFPQEYLADQKFHPLRAAFNLYMDNYRDIKQINKEYLEQKLAKTHPFEGPEPALRYPMAHSLKGLPSWQRTEIKKQRLGIGRINDYV